MQMALALAKAWAVAEQLDVFVGLGFGTHVVLSDCCNMSVGAVTTCRAWCVHSNDRRSMTQLDGHHNGGACVAVLPSPHHVDDVTGRPSDTPSGVDAPPPGCNPLPCSLLTLKQPA